METKEFRLNKKSNIQVDGHKKRTIGKLFNKRL